MKGFHVPYRGHLHRHGRKYVQTHVALHSVYWIQAAFTTPNWPAQCLYGVLAALTIVVGMIEDENGHVAHPKQAKD